MIADSSDAEPWLMQTGGDTMIAICIEIYYLAVICFMAGYTYNKQLASVFAKMSKRSRIKSYPSWSDFVTYSKSAIINSTRTLFIFQVIYHFGIPTACIPTSFDWSLSVSLFGTSLLIAHFLVKKNNTVVTVQFHISICLIFQLSHLGLFHPYVVV